MENTQQQPTVNFNDILKAIQTIQQSPVTNSGWMQGVTQSAGIGTPVTPEKILVPISIPTPIGKIRIYFQFPGELAADPQRLLQFLQNLLNTGLPLDVWQNSQASGWNVGRSRRWN
jgi:hypothetical protein